MVCYIELTRRFISICFAEPDQGRKKTFRFVHFPFSKLKISFLHRKKVTETFLLLLFSYLIEKVTLRGQIMIHSHAEALVSATAKSVEQLNSKYLLFCIQLLVGGGGEYKLIRDVLFFRVSFFSINS